jgi:cysteine desulfurase
MSDQVIYFDYSVTTPTDPRVVEAMQPYWTGVYGDPANPNVAGKVARKALSQAREQIAAILNSKPEYITFTACGTESNYLAIQGAARAMRERGLGSHIVISSVAHSSALAAVEGLVGEGFEVTYLPVDMYGRITEEQVEKALRYDTVLVSTVYASSYVGTINPIGDIGTLLKDHPAVFHLDGVQAPGQLTVDMETLHVDLLTLAAHKFYGPKGVGLVATARNVKLKPLFVGDGKEFGRRAGMEPLPLIVGMAEALRIVDEEREETIRRLIPMRDDLMRRVLWLEPDAFLIGHPIKRLPGHTSFAVRDLDANAVLLHLDEAGIAAGGGLQKIDGELRPHPTLVAMGVGEDRQPGYLRFVLGKYSTQEHIDRLAEMLSGSIQRFWSTMVADA